jgi:hypothetical protein
MTTFNTAVLMLLPLLLVTPAADANSFAARPCGLLSDKTVSAVLHQAMAVAPAELIHTSSQCEWTPGGKALVALAETPGGLTLLLFLEQDGSPGWERDTDQLDHPAEFNATRISGLGDRAILIAQSVNFGPEMLAQKGGNIVELQFSASNVSRKNPVTAAQMQALAKEALTHL